MIVPQQKSRIIEKVEQVKDILNRVSTPGNRDNLKEACEIVSLFVDDMVIADNMRDYWACQNSGQADWRG